MLDPWPVSVVQRQVPSLLKLRQYPLGVAQPLRNPVFFGTHLRATPLHDFVNGVLKGSQTCGYDVNMQLHPHSCVGFIKLAPTHVNVVTGKRTM